MSVDHTIEEVEKALAAGSKKGLDRALKSNMCWHDISCGRVGGQLPGALC